MKKVAKKRICLLLLCGIITGAVSGILKNTLFSTPASGIMSSNSFSGETRQIAAENTESIYEKNIGIFFSQSQENTDETENQTAKGWIKQQIIIAICATALFVCATIFGIIVVRKKSI